MSVSVADTNSEGGVFLAMIAFYCINFYFPCCRLYSNEDAWDKIIRILHVTFAGDEIIDDVLLHNVIPITEWCLAAAAAEIWMAGAALMQIERVVVGTMNDGCSISHCHLRSDLYTILVMT